MIAYHDADGFLVTFLAQRRLEDRHRGLLLLFRHVAERYAVAWYDRDGEVAPIRFRVAVELKARLLALRVVQRPQTLRSPQPSERSHRLPARTWWSPPGRTALPGRTAPPGSRRTRPGPRARRAGCRRAHTSSEPVVDV